MTKNTQGSEWRELHKDEIDELTAAAYDLGVEAERERIEKSLDSFDSGYDLPLKGQDTYGDGWFNAIACIRIDLLGVSSTLSLCQSCSCMTKTVAGVCGKCGQLKINVGKSIQINEY